MRFLLLLTQVEEEWEKAPPGEGDRVYEQYMAVERDIKNAGAFAHSFRLCTRHEAKTIRNLPEGKREFADGPCFESREAIGGMYILECASMDEAVDWAKRLPNYGHGAIEIRPLWE